MAKPQISYNCNNCGAVYSKWSGKCDACGEWNTITEDTVSSAAAPVPKGLSARGKGRVIEFVSLKDKDRKIWPRLISGIKEFDRVAGGGLVPGSAVLIGGDPGIGKSTLLLQVVCKLAMSGKRCLYISGEEAVDQVRMRAERLKLDNAPVELASATNVRDIIASIDDKSNPPAMVIIDSIQTMYIDNIDSAPGTVTQVRACTQEIIRTAKALNIAVMFVGHVTKEGQIAGPRVLEHIVDTVLYFEGDRSHQFRILRGVKNRFGPTDEIGVFEMVAEGLSQVENPSALFLSQRNEDVSGSAVLAGLEGTRPLLVEVQALLADAAYGTPRRSVIGWDSNRLAMICAVLETRCGLNIGGYDIFLNIAGGIKVGEPAADLAVAAALISALREKPLPHDMVFFGEIGLSGEIRAVSQPDLRLREAEKLGFHRAIIPHNRKKAGKNLDGMKVQTIERIADLTTLFS